MPTRTRTPGVTPEGDATVQIVLLADGATFRISRLGDAPTHYVVIDVQRRRVAREDNPIVDPLDINISDAMRLNPPGTYIFQIFDGALDDHDKTPGRLLASAAFHHIPAGEPVPVDPQPAPLRVSLDRAAGKPTTDEVLSTIILGATSDRSFAAYRAFVDPLVCGTNGLGGRLGYPRDSYRRLVDATWEFLRRQTAFTIDGSRQLVNYLTDGMLPYIENVVQRYPDARIGDPCSDINPDLLMQPFPVELIWSYWQEEGSLVQSLYHILARFQNRRVTPGADPLARFDLSPLRPLRQLLWSWAEDEISRLTVRRRAAEYEFEYGLTMIGRAVPRPSRYVERRTQFLESFHTLLHEAQVFFHLDDDMTVTADAFGVLNALRETHIVLSQGASNQFGDLPTEARAQMLIMQWLLAQPEMRDFLGGRPMVPYEEPWMDRVDTMKALNHWSSTSVTHFHDLAVRGEQLLLSIRYGNWNGTAVTADSARNWARTWRNQIQRYTHAYRATTGVDLVVAVDATMPADLLARRAATESRRA